MYHSAAVGYLYGAAGEKQYSDEVVNSKEVIEFREKISPTVDNDYKSDEAYTKVTLKDGSVHEYHVKHATGSIDNP
ncbi:hypothetical protein [Sinobaca sp. H24]|uniref:hypothetical protein n=1 Tax=Sinobaca sp. H24 TaxID=2923376 RepID=UPI0035AD9FC5